MLQAMGDAGTEPETRMVMHTQDGIHRPTSHERVVQVVKQQSTDR